MTGSKNPFVNFSGELLKQTLYLVPLSVAVGSVVAFFLWLLHAVTLLHYSYPLLLYILPLAGLLIHFIYQSVGKSSEGGNNLIIDEIHEPGAGVPPQMAPVILISTVITHLFGGSAGREGTAVQIGGSIADALARLFKLDAASRKLMLIAGIAAGFGAVFGTPIAGAVFAIEVLIVGRIKYDAFLPCLAASFLADVTVSLIGVRHTAYHLEMITEGGYFFAGFFGPGVLLLGKVLLASAAFGIASLLFAKLAHDSKRLVNNLFAKKWLIPLFGGLTIILLTTILNTNDYLGLGVESRNAGAITIVSSFKAGGAEPFSWFWKLIYTVITLGTGFKGGEVTPLFFIGATLGNSVAALMQAPVSLFAALGFIAVFAGATKTPLASTIMGAELFGYSYILVFAIACFTAFYCSGGLGIYQAQRKKGVANRSGSLQDSF